ncbi:MAG: hypothetical protein Q9176_006598 [Flavoplaca citrina]
MSTTTAQPKLRHKSAMLNLFVSQKEINKLKADLQLRQNRRKPTPPANTPPPSTTPPPSEATPTPAPDPTAPPPTPFTTAEDIALLHLRTLNKSFSEIATTLTPRTAAELEARWKEIGLPASTNEAEKASEDKTEPSKPVANAKDGDTGKANAGGGAKGQKSGKGVKGGTQKPEGNKQQKGNKNNAAKGKNQPTVLEDTEEETITFTDPTAPAPAAPSVIIASAGDQKVRGILKRGGEGSWQQEEMVIPVGATSLNGRPIIYIEEGDILGVDEVSL